MGHGLEREELFFDHNKEKSSKNGRRKGAVRKIIKLHTYIIARGLQTV